MTNVFPEISIILILKVATENCYQTMSFEVSVNNWFTGEKDINNKIDCQSSNGVSKWEEVELITSWGTMRGKKWGLGPRKILGVHGWLDNANTFDQIVPMFKEDITLVSLDLPGHGKSDHFESSFIYDPRGYVASIKKAADALEWSA